MDNPNKISVLKSMRLDANLVNTIKRMAKGENRSFSNMVETLLKKEVGKYENK